MASLMTQLKAHKDEVLIGGAGIAVTAALYLRSKSKNATTAASTTSASGATVVTPGYIASPGATVATTSGTDAYNGMETQILGLQQDLMGLTTSGFSTRPAGTTIEPGAPVQSSSGSGAGALQPTVALATEVRVGTGYSAGPGYKSGIVAGSTGADWSTLSTFTATIAAIDSGANVGYESSLGNFTPITSVSQFKTLEHTQKGPQTTTWVKP